MMINSATILTKNIKYKYRLHFDRNLHLNLFAIAMILVDKNSDYAFLIYLITHK